MTIQAILEQGLNDEISFRNQVRDYCQNELPSHVLNKVQANLFLSKQDNQDFLESLIPRNWVAGHWPIE